MHGFPSGGLAGFDECGWRRSFPPVHHMFNLGEFAMKKSLIALAVLAASGAAMAQSSVSAICEVFKLLGQPGIISFAGGFPDSALFDVAHIEEAARQALAQQAAQALQYGATEGFMPLREQLAALMQSRGADVQAQQLIVTSLDRKSVV